LLEPSEYLNSNGPLAQKVEGFAPRQQQMEMADAVAHALECETTFVAEAGTGTGKTFAYLVPALLSGRKILISTGTKNLQDQLFHKDLPIVREALDMPITAALLKGRSNYLCKHRLSLAEQDIHGETKIHILKLRQIRNWAIKTKTGDTSEIPEISEGDGIWPVVTSTSENCIGTDCDDYNDCHVVNARRLAQASDVVVINHYLLLSDMVIRENGFGELLPIADAFIIDEAHQLPDVASNFFGTSVSGYQLKELIADVTTEYLAEINEDKELLDLCEDIKKTIADFRLAMGLPIRRGGWSEIQNNSDFKNVIVTLNSQVEELKEYLAPLADRTKDLDACYNRSVSILERLQLLTISPPSDHIHWFETYKRSFSLHLTPFDVGNEFKQQMDNLPGSWIFTSATLTVGNKFDHFLTQLGILDDVSSQVWDSPFNYREQALLYIPDGLPEPQSQDYLKAVVEKAIPIINLSEGRTFFLFTSYRALNEALELLKNKIDFPLLVQGEKPRDALITDFRKMGNAVLLGTYSFWEGIDVKGDALTTVIIDKLPFASPGDPILKARIDAMRDNGLNPFFDFQLPNAVITLKQGAGRLIRDYMDSGLLMLCDPRLRTKPYGKIFLKSLPIMPITKEFDYVKTFFSEKVNVANDEMKS